MTDTAIPAAEATRLWRDAYEQNLRSDWGWLTVTGLHWLDDGSHTIGSAADAAVMLGAGDPASGSAVPAEVANIEVSGDNARLDVLSDLLKDERGPVASGPVEFDAHGRGRRMTVGRQSMIVVRRRGRIGVRTFDNDSEQRKTFPGCRWFDVADEWRVEARFEAFPEPRVIRFPTVLGDESEVVADGDFVFELGGRTHRLVSTGGGTRLFFVLRDGTSGRETYGASRFLTADPPVAGRTILDFNRLYNPPCAFTPHATCPLPPAGNVLDLEIRAGELAYLP